MNDVSGGHAMMRSAILALMVLLGALSSTLTAESEYSIDHPVPMGTAAPVGDYTVRVVAYIPDASDEITARHDDNSPPEAGFVYALITLQVTYEGDAVGQASSLFWQFSGSSRSAFFETFCTGPGRNVVSDSIDSAASEVDIFPGGWVEFDQCVYLPVEEAEAITMAVLTPTSEWVYFRVEGEMREATPAASSHTDEGRSA
jgi:hypothetical protein